MAEMKRIDLTTAPRLSQLYGSAAHAERTDAMMERHRAPERQCEDRIEAVNARAELFEALAVAHAMEEAKRALSSTTTSCGTSLAEALEGEAVPVDLATGECA